MQKIFFPLLLVFLLTTIPMAAAEDSSLWNTHMHGISDDNANSVPISSLDDGKTNLRFLHTAKEKMGVPGNGIYLELAAGEHVNFPVPLFDARKLYSLRGETIRIFYWLTGEKTGEGTPLFDGVPRLTFTLQTAGGFTRFQKESLGKTRGSFPWFCYYVDIQIPPKAGSEQPEDEPPAPQSADQQKQAQAITFRPFPPKEGLFLGFSNPASGIARFTKISWMKISPSQTLYNQDFRAAATHPDLGTLAPNAQYDELPMHLAFPLAQNVSWKWLKGTKTLPDLTKTDKIISLLKQHESDWAYHFYALPELIYMYKMGSLLHLLPEMEDAWDAQVLGQILAMRNEETGLWGPANAPNVFATSTLVNHSFRPQIQLSDGQMEKCDWYSVNGQELPHCDKVIRTILALRQKDSSGNLAGWNNESLVNTRAATEETTLSHCDILATSAAVRLLKRILQNTTPEGRPSATWRMEAEKTIQSAWNYVLSHLFRTPTLWVSQANDGDFTTPEGFFRLAEDAGWIDFHSDLTLPRPVLAANLNLEKDTLILSWKNPGENLVSLRIALAPTAVSNEKLTLKHLIAIVQPANNGKPLFPIQNDSLFAAREITTAIKQKCNYTPQDDDASLFDSRIRQFVIPSPSYLDSEKIVRIALPLVSVENTIRIAGVTPTGMMTGWVTLPLVVSPQEEEAEKTASPSPAPESSTPAPQP